MDSTTILCLTKLTRPDARLLNGRDTKVFAAVYMSETSALDQKLDKYMQWDKDMKDQPDPAVVAILDGSLPAKILFNRCKVHTPQMKVTTQLFAWIALECDRPGTAVLWCRALYELWLKVKIEDPVTLSLWAKTFDSGWPGPKFYEDCWNAQKKVGEGFGGNLLDTAGFWESMDARRNA